MSMKKALAGAILAGGAILAPFAKGDTKQTDTNTVANTQEAGKTDKIPMPSWIPTTADGKFDEKKAKEQAGMLWAEDGKDIQQFADDVKSGMSEEDAFNWFAKRLAKGDKEKEQQVLSLYKAVKDTYTKREGKMNDTPTEKLPVSAGAGLGLGLLAALIVSVRVENKKNAKLLALYAGLIGTVVGTFKGLDIPSSHYSEETFVRVQKAMYDSYKQQDTSKKYTMTDMQTAKEMIEKDLKRKETKSTKSDYRKAEKLSRQMLYNQIWFGGH